MRRFQLLAAALGFVTLAGGCSQGHQKEQLFREMGPYHRTVATASPEAQRFFDQGLIWAYAFNHDEAIRSFEAAARRDPHCAMAWWGAALAHGPHINNPIVTPEHAAAAWKALGEAKKYAAEAPEVERDLITALAQRYSENPTPDRKMLDWNYMAAMGKNWRVYRNDPDVGTLYAEALMDLQPWDLWTPSGEPKGATLEILSVLESVLEMAPNHPGANHLYIHAVENSPNPEKGNPSADRLRDAVPLSGHITHMPSHIDVQVGRWAMASDQNEKAIEADRRYTRAAPREQGFYRVYMAHNKHFLSFAAMMEGRRAVALKAAREMVAAIPPEFVRDHPEWADGFTIMPMEVLMRFGDWDAMLSEPPQPVNLPVSVALHHFGRGVAYAAKNDLPAAQREHTELRAAAAKLPPNWMININSAATIVGIADHVLAGEIAYRKGTIDAAVAELRRAVELEDSLKYMEPPDWIQPVRHTLGAVLVDADRYAEAETVYREDLKNWPENGWSLHGLALCLRARHADAEAAEVEARFAKVWSRADVKAGPSCLCVEGKRGETAAAY